MKKNYVLSIAASVLMLVSVKASAQAPANDDCTGAILMTQGTSKSTCNPVNVNTTAATLSTPTVTSCSSLSIKDDVWYKFVATSANVTARASNKGGGLHATTGIGFTLYDGCGGNELACNFHAAGDTMIFSSLTVGSTYYIRTYTTGDSVRGTYSLCVYTFAPPAAPANDICTNAINLTPSATCSPTSGNLFSAVQENAPDSCSGLAKSSKAKDVWYKFTAAQTKQSISVSSTSIAAEIILYQTCGGTSIACANPTTIGGTTTLNATVNIGTTYFIRVYNFETGTATDGNFTICVFGTPPPPANDDCSGAIAITVAKNKSTCTTQTTVNTVGATQSTPHGKCAPNSSDDDVWYSFTANDTIMTVLGSNFGAGFTTFGASLFKGSCTALVEDSVDCKFNSADSVAFHPLIVGTKYYLEVFTTGTTATGTFNICVYGRNSKSGVGINEITSVASSLNVYPNPTKDQLHVVFTASSSANVRMINMNGQEVYLENYATFNGTYDKTIDMTNIAKGIYMLQITTDRETITRKIVRD